MARKVSIALICALAVAACSPSNSSESPTRGGRADLVGTEAPDFSVAEMGGGTFTLAQHRGKPVFIDFWATWCPPCRISTPEVMRLHEDFSGRGVEVVGVSLDDDMDKVQTFASEHDVRHRQTLSGQSGVDRAYGVRGIPMFVTVDKQGRVSRVWTGFSPSMASEWRAELERLLAA